MESQNEQKERLSKIAQHSLYGAGVSERSIMYCFRVFSRYIRGENILELGPAEGIMTNQLAGLGKHLTVVEGAKEFCVDIKRRHPSVDVVNALFEEYAPAVQFDNIIMGHVLEHVDDPAAIVRCALSWLKPGGCIMAAVPNSRSLHRQAGVLMGLLPFEEALNDLDRHHGHRRVFNPETFRKVFHDAGLGLEAFGGYWLKPVSNQQIDQTWNSALIEAYLQLGERYPDVACEIYVVAGRLKQEEGT